MRVYYNGKIIDLEEEKKFVFNRGQKSNEEMKKAIMRKQQRKVDKFGSIKKAFRF